MDVETGRRRTGLLIVGVVLVVIGLVWTGQGAGLVSGSSMTGKTVWLVIGIATGVCGLVVTIGTLLSRRRP